MKDRDLTTGKIFAPFISFTIPVFFAMILQAMYGAVDLIIIGQFGQASDVSAVSIGTQIMHVFTMFVTNISTGTTILIGLKIGQKKLKDVSDVIGTGIFLFTIIAILMTIISIFSAKPMANILNAPIEAYDKVISCVVWCGTGSIFIVAYNVLCSVFRGLGDSKTPLITVAIACIVNIFGDLLLIGKFGMGAKGAAIATVFAQAISVIISIIIIKKQKLQFAVTKKNIKPNIEYIKNTLKLGIPIALQDLLVGISFLVILGIVNSLGLIASAGVGVAEKVCAFIMLVPAAFSQAMSVFVSQNRGAKRLDRAKLALCYGIFTSFCCGVVLFYISFYHGTILTKIFTNDIEVINAGASYLKAYAIDCMFTAFLFCFIGFFSGLGKTRFVMIQGIVGAFAVRIPVSFLMSSLPNTSLFKIGLATPCSSLVQIVLCIIYLIICKKELSKLKQ